MDRGTFRQPIGPLPPRTYWWRRLAVLIVLLSAVATVAWACAESGGGAKKGVGASAAGAQATLPTAPPRPTVTTTVTVTVAPSPAPGTSPTASSQAPRQGTCEDLEVTVRPDRSSYGEDDKVGLVVTVENVGEKACVRDVGPKELTLAITSGADVVWSSADCGKGTSEVRELAPGKPYETTVAWDRTRSNAAMCGKRQAAAEPGWYVAVARLGRLWSEKAVFQLR